MGIKIALAGNPNCCKTTMFNAFKERERMMTLL